MYVGGDVLCEEAFPGLLVRVGFEAPAISIHGWFRLDARIGMRNGASHSCPPTDPCYIPNLERVGVGVNSALQCGWG
jgi:hypothetical protein